MISKSKPKNVKEEPQEKEEAEDVQESRYFVGAFAKGLAVLRAFGAGASALTLSQVAERTGLTRPGARRYLLTLQDLGYAVQNGRHFSLTPRVLSLGYAYLSSTPFWLFAEPILERLVQDIGETCSLSVLDDTEVVFVLRIPVHRVLNAGLTIGSRLPAYSNSMGRQLLCGLTDAQLDSYFSRVQLTPFTSRTVTDPKQLKKLIAEVRTKGYAWVSSEMEEGISGLSVPVLDSQGRILAALNVSINRTGVSEKTMVAKFLPRLRRAAEQMTTSLAIADRPAD